MLVFTIAGDFLKVSKSTPGILHYNSVLVIFSNKTDLSFSSESSLLRERDIEELESTTSYFLADFVRLNEL